ncbi:MAG TPA: M14 family zinc carboxypeptidase [Verrucomicrobiae bacterium]|nr:M14 family zinc carboxypeptidase [Verrucomicrobiae bacterium]
MYHNIFEIESAIQNFATAHPAICERIPLPETSFEGKTISCLRLGSQAAGAVDGILLAFGHHARELVPPEIALALAADLVDGYVNNHGLTYGGKSYSATQVHQILDNACIFLVPCVNPDGRFYAQNTDRDWRKNRNTANHASCIGTDLNRNYDFAFDLNKYFDTVNSAVTTYTSTNPCDKYVYQGPNPFSEPETRNIRWLLDSYGRMRWFVDIHGYTSQGEIYHPWGDDQNQNGDAAMNWRNPAFDHQRGRAGDSYKEHMYPGDQATHVFLANRLRDGIQPVHSRTYIVQQSFALYPTAGDSESYTWSRHLTAPFLPRVESFTIEVRGTRFDPSIAEKDEIVLEVASGLVNFCLACACGVPGLTAELRTTSVVFNHCPEGRTSSRPVILQVTGCDAATFRITSGPTRTGGSSHIGFGVAVATKTVPAVTSPVTRDLYLWLTCSGGLAGDTANGTVRVECPETAQSWTVNLAADFVAQPRAGAVLVLDRSGSMQDDGGDGRTRLQVLLDSAPAFVDVAPQGSRIGLVRFATDASSGAPMTNMGPEGADPGGRGVIRTAISNHTLASGDASFTSIGDGVYAGNALIAPASGLDFKSLVVLTDGYENRSRYISEVSGLINDRVFAIGLGTPENIQPIALDALTNGTGGYMLMTGAMDADDPFRLAKYYLQILTGVTNDQVVLDPDGWLAFGESTAIPFHLNEADLTADVILMSVYPQLLRMRLRSPSGQIFDQSHPAMKLTAANRMNFYRFALPVPGEWSEEGPGRWEVLLDWKSRGKPQWEKLSRQRAAAVGVSRKALQYNVLVHARSDLEMTATLAQDRRTPGAKVTILARLAQYHSVPVENARVIARVRFPDGGMVTVPLPAIAEGAYQAEFTAPMAGVYTVRIVAEGSSLRGARFTREAVRTAAVWQRGDAPPPTSHDDGWCGLLRCLLESKAINPELLRRYGIEVDRMLKCCATEERSPSKKG